MEKLRKFPKIPESIPQRCLYAFGSFRVDPVKRLLLRGAEPISLSPKDFDLLLALVQHHGEVLVKEELMEKVWPDTVVEEGNLNRHISTLRKTLGESPNEHEYIVTVPGRGYRFVSEVREDWRESPHLSVQEADRIGLPPGDESSLGSTVPRVHLSALRTPSAHVSRPEAWGSTWRARSGLTWLALGTCVALVAISLAAGALLLSMRSKPILTNTDYILISDFVNTTSDPVFDDTLKQAVTVQLSQSPYLNILSEARIRTALQLMTRPPDTKLTPDVAREVCQRMESKAYIAGSIANLGSQYVVGLNSVNCQTGERLAQEQAVADDKEHVLKALGGAATKLRAKLGESLNTVQKYDVPLPQATTPSLEALKAYSMGDIARDRKGDAAAIPFFQHAVEIDPQFALAYDALGIAFSNLDEPGLAAENITKAYEMHQRASEREKFQITANYSQIVTGELEKANQICELWAQAYPRDVYPHNLLGVNYEFLGQYGKAIAEMQEAVRLNPDGVILRSNLMDDYDALSRLDEAKVTFRQALERKLDHPYLHADMYGVAFLQHDTAEMDSQVAWSIGVPGGEDLLLSAESDTKAFSGNLIKAREYSRRAVAAALRNNQKETAAEWQMNEALREAEFGNVELARQQTTQALSKASSRDIEILAALTLARVGDPSRARTMADDLAKRFPLNTVINGYWLPTIRAAIEINQGTPAKAIEVLAPAASYESGYPNPQVEVGRFLYPVFLRGQAYLLMQQGNAAAAEFQKILNAPGLILNCPLGALARLGLSRASALRGDLSKARSGYQDFFALWKDADSDIPMLRQARAEYSNLN
jgi:DNA-binding winged helix-turn-helix (wHTH) protein/tetratricopeptide (TPR) repeat protein